MYPRCSRGIRPGPVPVGGSRYYFEEGSRKATETEGLMADMQPRLLIVMIAMISESIIPGMAQE